MSEPILNFVACPWCASGNAADMGHWGKCPGLAALQRKAKDAVAEMFADLDAPVATATADQLRRKLLECEEALRTTEARAEKAEAELHRIRPLIGMHDPTGADHLDEAVAALLRAEKAEQERDELRERLTRTANFPGPTYPIEDAP